jgi:hypothetical protein
MRLCRHDCPLQRPRPRCRSALSHHGQEYCNGERDGNRCGEIRTAEAHKACEILKARPLFAGQYDGQPVVDNEHYAAFGKLLDAENPDILFAQWPIDKHRDHRALSNLVLDAWLRGGKKAAFFFYEVADDTMLFAPAQYVDISAVQEQRHALVTPTSRKCPTSGIRNRSKSLVFGGAFWTGRSISTPLGKQARLPALII